MVAIIINYGYGKKLSAAKNLLNILRLLYIYLTNYLSEQLLHLLNSRVFDEIKKN